MSTGRTCLFVKPTEASKEVATVNEEFYRRMSFPCPPNFVMAQGHSYAVARGTWELRAEGFGSGRDSALKETISVFVAISRDRNCRVLRHGGVYCLLPYARRGCSDDEWGRVRSRFAPDPKLREMILFALKCSRSPQSLHDRDYTKLRKCGLKQSEIMELVGMCALSVYANIIADATAMAEDEMFGAL